MDSRYKILQGDSVEVLKTLEAGSVDCIVTSPPYFGLRKYGSGDKEIGQEETPVEFVDKLVAVFREAHRVLKDTGTLFVNLGDTYNGDKKGNTEVVKNPKLASTSDGLCKKKWGGGAKEITYRRSVAFRNRNVGRRVGSSQRHHLGEAERNA